MIMIWYRYYNCKTGDLKLPFAETAEAGWRQAGGGQGSSDQGLGDQQTEGAGGTEPAPEGAECPLQWADGPAEEQAGAAAGTGPDLLQDQQQERERRGGEEIRAKNTSYYYTEQYIT